jgi:uncharacterized membrane protein
MRTHEEGKHLNTLEVRELKLEYTVQQDLLILVAIMMISDLNFFLMLIIEFIYRCIFLLLFFLFGGVGLNPH